jgi:hypothetical protein
VRDHGLGVKLGLIVPGSFPGTIMQQIGKSQAKREIISGKEKRHKNEGIETGHLHFSEKVGWLHGALGY